MSSSFDETPAFRARKERVVQQNGQESFRYVLTNFTQRFQEFINEQAEMQAMAANSQDGMANISPEEMVTIEIKGRWYEGLHGFMTRHYRRLAQTGGQALPLETSFNKSAPPLTEAEIARLDAVRDNIVSATSIRIMSEARKYHENLVNLPHIIAEQISQTILDQAKNPELRDHIDPEMLDEQARFVSDSIRTAGQTTIDQLYDELLDIVMPPPSAPPANDTKPKNTPPSLG